MSFKSKYVELSDKLGGPYSLISLGIKKGVITGIMRGSIPRADNAYRIANIFGVNLSDLLEDSVTYPFGQLRYNFIQNKTVGSVLKDLEDTAQALSREDQVDLVGHLRTINTIYKGKAHEQKAPKRGKHREKSDR